jgi:hypothetical protein
MPSPGAAPSPGRALGAALACLALGLALGGALLGCAAPLRIEASAEPLGLLQEGSLVYARLGGAASREFARSALGTDQATALAPVLDRTRLLALGLGSAGGSEDPPSFQACLIGDYPYRAAALSLGSSSGWKREKVGFFNPSLGLRAALPGPGLVLVSSGSLERLLAGARSPGASPIPSRLEGFASGELLFWVPELFSGLATTLLGPELGGDLELPATGLLLAARPAAEKGSYEASVVFLTKDPATARIYRPVLRLAWFAMARYLFGEAEGPLSASFSLDGELYLATGLRLSSEEIGRAFAKLGARFEAERKLSEDPLPAAPHPAQRRPRAQGAPRPGGGWDR